MIYITNLNIAYDLVYRLEEILLQIMSTKEVKINRTESLTDGVVLLIPHVGATGL